MASSSGFSTRNAYYLRISRDTVLSLYIYVEQPYVDWMTDYTLQKVLMALRPLIRPKLEFEAQMDKKAASTPEVIIGDDFRFCFFLRPSFNDRHTVLLKDRHYVPRPMPGQETVDDPEPQQEGDAPSSPPVTGARQGQRRKRGRDESEQAMSDEPADPVEIKPEDDGRTTIDEILAATSAAAPERDAPRGRGLFDYSEQEADEDDKPKVGPAHSLAQDTTASEEEEEKKAKPLLEMRYQGFSIYSSQLVIIVEPYPLPAATSSMLRRSSSVSVPPTPRPRASSTFSTSTSGTRRTFDRTPSASPWPSRPSANSRSGTPANEPLFRPMTPLGDEDAEEEQRRDEERQRRWASWRDRSLSVLPSREDSVAPPESTKADDDPSTNDGLDGGGMTNLTQSLMNVGGRQGVDEGED